MPIYEYVCSACGHRTDILHGIDDTGPHFCPECGAEGSMRKAFAPPTIHFKGSGWAKRDRSTSKSSSGTKSDSGEGEGKAAAASTGGDASSSSTTKESTSTSSGSTDD